MIDGDMSIVVYFHFEDFVVLGICFLISHLLPFY